MCGIIGYIGPKPVVPVLIDGLRKLEYRGYDSAGVAVVNGHGIDVRRSAGKLANLEQAIVETPIAGIYGLGHTRWATHGRPTEENAHPHRDCTGRIVVVHNGIIENYLELKQELQGQGHAFVTETDTEVVAHLVEAEGRGDGLEQAVLRAMVRLRGLFAIVLISADDPEKIVAVRNGPPVVVGLGDDEWFVASDIPAILQHTRDVAFLDDGEMAVVTRAGARFCDLAGRPLDKRPQRVTWDPVQAEKAGYKHFMLKEIFEQPTAVRETILGRVSRDTGLVFLDEMALTDEDFGAIDKVLLVACGTSWHAALVGKFLIEQLAGVPTEVDYGSEFRYRRPIVTRRTLAVVITQSGETADTLAALREAKARGARSLAICNVVGSMATREAEGTLYTHAGPEIGVASTKAFTCQLVALHLLAMYLGQVRGTLTEARRHALIEDLLDPAQAAGDGAAHQRPDRGDRRALSHPCRFPLPRARHPLSDRARGGAQAQGNLLHPCRGLSGRGDEARPHCPHRRTDADRRAGHERSRLREDVEQHPGGQGARRHRHRHRDRRRPHALNACSTPAATRSSPFLPRRRSWRRSSPWCRCSSSRITSRCAAAATSINRGTWRSRSR